MNARKNARTNMITTVIELFKTDHAAYKFAPALVEDIADLTRINTDLEASLEKAELSTTDLTAAKKDLKAIIVASAKTIIAVGNAHASKKEDKQLGEQLATFGKQLAKAKDTEVSMVCSNLLKNIKSIDAEELAKRGLQESDIAMFEAKVLQFKGHVSKNKGVRDDTSTEISRSEALTNEACTIVNRIGLTMCAIKDKLPDFYARFDKASTIRKPASIVTQLKIITIDAATDEKIEGAAISDLAQTFAKKTASKGHATLKNGPKVKKK